MKKFTDEELVEEIRKRFNDSNRITKEYKDLMKQLWRTNEKLEESEAMKSHFISNVTNEIINPFTSIIGLSSSIMASKPENIDKIKQMASLIHSEAFNLDFQLNNIFSAAKLEAGDLTLDIFKTNIKEIINSTISSFLIEASKKSLQIKVVFDGVLKTKPNTAFNTDPNKFKIIFANLISNAIKFSTAATDIEINCKIDKELLLISVKNYGVGIDKKNQEIIFDRFKRLDENICEQNRGNGLGLSVTKSLLDILNGSIEVNSHSKFGTTFKISIPESVSNKDTSEFSSNDNIFLFKDKDQK